MKMVYFEDGLCFDHYVSLSVFILFTKIASTILYIVYETSTIKRRKKNT